MQERTKSITTAGKSVLKLRNCRSVVEKCCKMRENIANLLIFYLFAIFVLDVKIIQVTAQKLDGYFEHS